MSLLEATAPDLDLTDPLPVIVLPVDALKLIVDSRVYKANVNFRPSLRSQLGARMPRLNPAADASSQARQLDALDNLIGFRHNKELVANDKEVTKWREQVLAARSRFQLRGGYRSGRGPVVNLGFRCALRDLLDPDLGLSKNAEIEMFSGEIDYQVDGQRPNLQRLDLVRISSLAPWTKFHRPLSWQVRLGMESMRTRDCLNFCAAWRVPSCFSKLSSVKAMV